MKATVSTLYALFLIGFRLYLARERSKPQNFQNKNLICKIMKELFFNFLKMN